MAVTGFPALADATTCIGALTVEPSAGTVTLTPEPEGGGGGGGGAADEFTVIVSGNLKTAPLESQA
jgi:hypothetical protein